jgi:hypothetical protein
MQLPLSYLLKVLLTVDLGVTDSGLLHAQMAMGISEAYTAMSRLINGLYIALSHFLAASIFDGRPCSAEAYLAMV